MMRATVIGIAIASASAGVVVAFGQEIPAPATARVTVANLSTSARPSETIELAVPDLKRFLTFTDARRIHVRDDKMGRDVLTQAIDLDSDGAFDQLIFQADIGASETRAFSLSVGDRRVPAMTDYRAYGRFVRERFDDFAWENDLVAHRMYGAALETAPQGPPLTSSAVDVWVKNTPKLVINDWYLLDDYHANHGQGGDFYASGASRGCGGNGIWRDGKLYPSANFRTTTVLANGPIRVLFELGFDAWDAGGSRATETKRISLDAGQRMNRFESRYTIAAPGPLAQAAGIKQTARTNEAARKDAGILRTWEPLDATEGNVGCGVIADPGDVADIVERADNYLMITWVHPGVPAVYWAGTAWDRGGAITTPALWDAYLDEWVARLRAPVIVSISKR